MILIPIDLFEAVNLVLKENIKIEVLVRSGKHNGHLTYGRKGLHIWQSNNGKYHKITRDELNHTYFYKVDKK